MRFSSSLFGLAAILTVDTVCANLVATTAVTTTHTTTSSAPLATLTNPNWSGAGLVGTGYTQVNATWTVPAICPPSGGDPSTQYGAYAWVGIDGYTCPRAILQTGIYMLIQNGQTTYGAWAEWYPNLEIYFPLSEISFKEGDTVFAEVVATSSNSGIASVINKSTGQKVTHTYTDQAKHLCFQDAEWIVEDYTNNTTGAQEPFVDFHGVTFEDTLAVRDGHSEGTSSGNVTIFDLQNSTSHRIVATGSVRGGHQVLATYVG